METLTEAMRRAADIYDMRDYVNAVKIAARQTFTQLDRNVELEDTQYFNHSAVPDFMLKWPNRPARPMYLRNSFEEINAAQDVPRLSLQEPVLVSLKERAGDSQAEASLRQELQQNGHAQHVLVTGSRAVDSLVAPLEEASPLRGVIGAELLPQGRGLLDETAAQRIFTPSTSLTDDLAEFLSEKAMGAVREIASIMQTSLNPHEPPPVLRGALSAEDAQELIPWLLTSQGVRQDRPFWASIGAALSLSTLERISQSIANLDLSPLLFAVWDSWQAKRAYRGIAEPFREDAAPSTHWYMNDRGVLNFATGETEIRFTTDGRSLVGKGSSSSATWEKIRSRLDNYRLLEISLRGLSRTILLNANQSPDIRSDAEKVHSSLDDTYFVDEVRIQPGVRDEDRDIRLQIGADLALNEGAASLKDLAGALLSVVQYDNPVSVESLDPDLNG